MPPLNIVHYSDILCVWAYVGQEVLRKTSEKFGDQIEIRTRFCSVFPDTHGKIEKAWNDRGGFDGYAKHVRQVVDRFPGNPLHKDTWSKTRPMSSASPHLFVKAVGLVAQEEGGPPFSNQMILETANKLRTAFFAEAQDISDWSVQEKISESLNVDYGKVRSKVETGEAIASLAADYEEGQASNVRGSPTYILNDGRQILFGNISYGILQANIAELLTEQSDLKASPC